MKPYVVGFIFARGGSKDVPRKNIRPLAGKPLIAYAIETAHDSKLIDRVIVSTDNAEIAKVAQQYGAEVPFMRSPELAGDDSPEWLAWQHAIRTFQEIESKSKMDVFASIPTTSPLRTVADLDACVKKLLESDADVVITVKPAEHNPYFNMIMINETGHAQLVIKPEQTIHLRQSAPPVYDITTVAYAARPEFVLRANSLFEGNTRAVVVPAGHAIDIDTELDFKLTELLMRESIDQEIA
jgi:N-acylneuraminate cytidylyltransferase